MGRQRMRVLVTGATGFVGGWIAKAVHEHGHEVRLLARSPEKVADSVTFLGFDPDVVVGDIGDPDAVRRALTGCDAVIHAAAEVALHAGKADDLVRRNVEACRNVLGQAADLSMDPIVYVSSSGALWDAAEPGVAPNLPVRGGPDAYGQSKAAGERCARELQDAGHPVVIVYPTAVMGPSAHGRFGEAGDAVITLTRAGVVGRTAALTIVDVRDVAELHARVLEVGRGPRRYVAGGHRLGDAELARCLSEITGRRIRHWPIPNSILAWAGRVADRVPGVVPPFLSQLSEAAIGYLVHAPIPDNTAAENDLGMTFLPAAETLAAVWDEHPSGGGSR
ncbi:NAD-dependent epimerase/dehydratase family protein [Gordonia liuliyuniae]|uniref:NAD-dependent epimerase/dehydratase family protein n=1 Tax=Gordonia liuliyuniae TaxID=2911517 RepID=A0ABS9IX34_9ACTN|nr:NAD-dependent epimerase/dehydratase family protein [Gordonia liuliyuniae]MCF8590135.1 NAD-dependent epimerase/dehydratase family protein [Gordonia liuliyuniae]